MEPETVLQIVGMQRSGNTLLRVMLDSHPQLCIPDESQFRLAMTLARKSFEHSGDLDVEAFIEALGQQSSFQRWQMDAEDVRIALKGLSEPTFPRAMEEVFACYARREGKERHGDKTPDATTQIQLLATTFPWLRFVHILRDGRDVALSQVNHPRGIRSVGEAAIYWKRGVEKARAAGKRLSPERYMEIRYEDLLDAPDETLRKICTFIDLPFDEVMLDYYKRAPSVYSSEKPPEGHESVYLPPTKGLRDWRSQMDPSDVEVFESIAGDLLEELGYERANRAISASARRKATKAHYLIRLKRALSPLRNRVRTIKASLTSR